MRTQISSWGPAVLRTFTVSILIGAAIVSPAQTTQTIPATWGYPLGSQDSAAPGFEGRIHQARQNANLTATSARGNAQLNGTLIDADTGEPFVNLAVDTNDEIFTSGFWTGTFPVAPGGTFVETNVINYAVGAAGDPVELGRFTSAEGYTDSIFPGLPGATDDSLSDYSNVSNFAMEHLAFLELRKGAYILGIQSDDAFEVAFHANDARDIFRKSVLAFDSNRGATESKATIEVEADGLYPVRILHVQHANSPPAEFEFYTVDPADPEARTLVNDRTVSTAVRAWRRLTSPTRPYIARVSPIPGSTGVLPSDSIEAVLVNAGTATPVMKVNGNTITPASSSAGNETTLTYKPASPFSGATAVNVELNYGNATATWSFVTRTGRKALLITGGGQLNASDGWMSQRLATVYGLDVVVRSDAAVTVDDAQDCVLVVNSATVSSGNVADDNFEELPIPLLNGEGGNLDDFIMHPGNAFGNANNVTSVDIVDPAHPIAAGLAAGVQTFSTANVQVHWGSPELDTGSTAVIGVHPSNPAQALIFAIDKDQIVDGFTHPERRVHLGIIGNTGAATLTAAGTNLFDATINWLLRVQPTQELKFNPPGFEGAQLVLTWVGNGVLQEAASLTGNQSDWKDVAPQPTGNRYVVPLSAAAQKFYRLKS